MQHNNTLTAHQLAEILLKGENYPVVVPSNSNKDEADFVQDIFVLSNTDSPFENCLLLQGSSSHLEDNLIEIKD